MFSEITKNRIKNFKKTKKAYYSFIILLTIFIISLFSELVANNKPLLLVYNNKYYFPFLFFYSGTNFGQTQNTGVEFNKLLSDPKTNLILYAPYKYGPYESYLDQIQAPPHTPNRNHWLGTDRLGRDVLVRLLYGFRISLLFSLSIVLIMVAMGVTIGAIQGYIGGAVDIVLQRIIEIWAALPFLYIVILLGSLYGRNFLLLVFIISLFNWIGLSYYMRAEFLKAKNMYYVKAANALGLSKFRILFKHILPNSLTPLITLLPFELIGGISILTALDFLGFGLQPPTPSWGELLKQGLEVIREFPHLTIITTSVFFITLLLATLIGEGIRDAFDPRSGSHVE